MNSSPQNELTRPNGRGIFNAIDTAPFDSSKESWNRWHIAALWSGSIISVSTYTIGGLLVTTMGLSIIEVFIVLLFTSCLTLLVQGLCANPGIRYGILSSIFMRASFGVIGAKIPVITCAIVSSGFVGMHALFGGHALNILMNSYVPSWTSMGKLSELFSFFLFLCANFVFVMVGRQSIKYLEIIAAPMLLIVGIGLFFWSFSKVEDLSYFYNLASHGYDNISLSRLAKGCSLCCGLYCGSLALLVSDFSRYTNNQKEWVIGQAIGFPISLILFAGLGAFLTVFSKNTTYVDSYDIVHFIEHIDHSIWKIIALLSVLLATLSTNVVNLEFAICGFNGTSIKALQGTYCLLIVTILVVLFCSLELSHKIGLINSTLPLQNQLVHFLLLGADISTCILSIVLIDYYFTRKRYINIDELYHIQNTGNSAYHYPAIFTFALTTMLFLIASRFEPLRKLYENGWIINMLVATGIYSLLIGYEYLIASKREGACW